MILYSSHTLFRDWVFGNNFCRVTNFMTHMSIVAAVCSHSSMAVERYMTIARPRSPHLSKKVGSWFLMKILIRLTLLQTTSSMLFIIWTVSVLVAIPTLLYSTTVLYSRTDTDTERFVRECI